jgi:hypothetical protein
MGIYLIVQEADKTSQKDPLIRLVVSFFQAQHNHQSVQLGGSSISHGVRNLNLHTVSLQEHSTSIHSCLP